MKLEDIIEAYMVARKNKRKSPDQVEFELHWELNCVMLCEAVNNRCYQPTAYTFVADHPKPREVFASDMSTRILHHYLDMRLRPFLEARMGEHTFNNRVGMGTNACQNAVISDIYEVSQGYTRDCYIVKLDLSGCFPNINQDIAYAQLRVVIEEDYHGEDKEDLLYILQVCIYSYPTHHCYRKSSLSKWDNINKDKSIFTKPDGIGAAIGHLIWQNAVNYYFVEIDIWIVVLGIAHERYVDDHYFVVPAEVLTVFLSSVIPEIRVRLAALGAKLNENKFYCQHYTKGVECLGLHIKMDRVYVNNRIVRRAKTKARQFNRCIRPEKIEPMLASINSYLGICKNVNGYNQARAIVATLSPKWFEYVKFNTHRVCLQALPEYKINELLTQKYKLYEQIRKRRDASASQRRAVGSDVNNEPVRRSREQVYQDGSQLPGGVPGGLCKVQRSPHQVQ